MLIVLTVDQTLEFPDLLVEDEVLGAQVFGRIALLVEGVDCFHDLVEDQQRVFLSEGFASDERLEGLGIGFCHQAHQRFADDLFLDFEEMLREEQGFGVAQDAAVELEALRNVELINGGNFEELDVERISVLIEALLHLDLRGAELPHLLVGDRNRCHAMYWLLLR